MTLRQITIHPDNHNSFEPDTGILVATGPTWTMRYRLARGSTFSLTSNPNTGKYVAVFGNTHMVWSGQDMPGLDLALTKWWMKL